MYRMTIILLVFQYIYMSMLKINSIIFSTFQFYIKLRTKNEDTRL
jgi:hypothetical protein